MYSVDPEQDQLRAEIMKHGPIEVDFLVYEDFLSYKSGKSQQRVVYLYILQYSLFLFCPVIFNTTYAKL